MSDAEANNETRAAIKEDNDDDDENEDDDDVDDDVLIERPLFCLEMRFSNATTATESIIWYGLSMGVTLKYVKNNSTRVLA